VLVLSISKGSTSDNRKRKSPYFLGASELNRTKPDIVMVPGAGLEPATRGFSEFVLLFLNFSEKFLNA
jgi:hypothetical protein